VGTSDEIIDAFISYQSADETFAHKLASSIEAFSLNERKLRVFFAPWDIKPGDNIVAKIDEGLEKARFYLIILSPEALKAEWPTAERAAAIYNDPSGRLGRVIPILRRPCAIPPLLRFRNYGDFRDESHYDAELTRLLCALTGQALPRECSPMALYRESLQKKSSTAQSPLVNIGESWRPDPVIEEIRCNLFLAETIPSKIWSAPYLLAGPPLAYFEPNVSPPPYITKQKRLFSFVNLSKENHAFKGVVEDYDIQSVDTAEWFNDEDHARWLVELLNWGIVKHCQKFKMCIDEMGRRHPRKKRYYYNKDVIMKQVKWPVADRRAPKDLLIEYAGFVAHRSVELKFEIIATKVFLKINTGWVFSYNGYRLIRGPRAKTLSTRFLSSQKNSQNFNEIRFWAWFLSEDGKKIKIDFGDTFVEINAQPFSTSVTGGIFGDYKAFSPIIRGPPKIFEEETGKGEGQIESQ
jgi:hypothetical protein